MTIRQLRDLLATMHPDGEALVTLFTPMALQRHLRLRMSPPRMARRTSKSLTRSPPPNEASCGPGGYQRAPRKPPYPSQR